MDGYSKPNYSKPKGKRSGDDLSEELAADKARHEAEVEKLRTQIPFCSVCKGATSYIDNTNWYESDATANGGVMPAPALKPSQGHQVCAAITERDRAFTVATASHVELAHRVAALERAQDARGAKRVPLRLKISHALRRMSRRIEDTVDK